MIRAGTALPRQAGAVTGPMPQAEGVQQHQLRSGRLARTTPWSSSRWPSASSRKREREFSFTKQRTTAHRIGLAFTMSPAEREPVFIASIMMLPATPKVADSPVPAGISRSAGATPCAFSMQSAKLAPGVTPPLALVSLALAMMVAGHAAGAVHHFDWSVVPSPQTAGKPFAVVVTARDSQNEVATDFQGPVWPGSPTGWNLRRVFRLNPGRW
jgi:hypothetical protein